MSLSPQSAPSLDQWARAAARFVAERQLTRVGIEEVLKLPKLEDGSPQANLARIKSMHRFMLAMVYHTDLACDKSWLLTSDKSRAPKVSAQSFQDLKAVADYNAKLFKREFDALEALLEDDVRYWQTRQEGDWTHEESKQQLEAALKFRRDINDQKQRHRVLFREWIGSKIFSSEAFAQKYATETQRDPFVQWNQMILGIHSWSPERAYAVEQSIAKGEMMPFIKLQSAKWYRYVDRLARQVSVDQVKAFEALRQDATRELQATPDRSRWTLRMVQNAQMLGWVPETPSVPRTIRTGLSPADLKHFSLDELYQAQLVPGEATAGWPTLGGTKAAIVGGVVSGLGVTWQYGTGIAGWLFGVPGGTGLPAGAAPQANVMAALASLYQTYTQAPLIDATAQALTAGTGVVNEITEDVKTVRVGLQATGARIAAGIDGIANIPQVLHSATVAPMGNTLTYLGGAVAGALHPQAGWPMFNPAINPTLLLPGEDQHAVFLNASRVIDVTDAAVVNGTVSFNSRSIDAFRLGIGRESFNAIADLETSMMNGLLVSMTAGTIVDHFGGMIANFCLPLTQRTKRNESWCERWSRAFYGLVYEFTARRGWLGGGSFASVIARLVPMLWAMGTSDYWQLWDLVFMDTALTDQLKDWFVPALAIGMGAATINDASKLWALWQDKRTGQRLLERTRKGEVKLTDLPAIEQDLLKLAEDSKTDDLLRQFRRQALVKGVINVVLPTAVAVGKAYFIPDQPRPLTADVIGEQLAFLTARPDRVDVFGLPFWARVLEARENSWADTAAVIGMGGSMLLFNHIAGSYLMAPLIGALWEHVLNNPGFWYKVLYHATLVGIQLDCRKCRVRNTPRSHVGTPSSLPEVTPLPSLTALARSQPTLALPVPSEIQDVDAAAGITAGTAGSTAEAAGSRLLMAPTLTSTSTSTSMALVHSGVSPVSAVASTTLSRPPATAAGVGAVSRPLPTSLAVLQNSGHRFVDRWLPEITAQIEDEKQMERYEAPDPTRRLGWLEQLNEWARNGIAREARLDKDDPGRHSRHRFLLEQLTRLVFSFGTSYLSSMSTQVFMGRWCNVSFLKGALTFGKSAETWHISRTMALEMTTLRRRLFLFPLLHFVASVRLHEFKEPSIPEVALLRAQVRAEARKLADTAKMAQLQKELNIIRQVRQEVDQLLQPQQQQETADDTETGTEIEPKQGPTVEEVDEIETKTTPIAEAKLLPAPGVTVTVTRVVDKPASNPTGDTLRTIQKLVMDWKPNSRAPDTITRSQETIAIPGEESDSPREESDSPRQESDTIPVPTSSLEPPAQYQTAENLPDDLRDVAEKMNQLSTQVYLAVAARPDVRERQFGPPPTARSTAPPPTSSTTTTPKTFAKSRSKKASSSAVETVETALDATRSTAPPPTSSTTTTTAPETSTTSRSKKAPAPGQRRKRNVRLGKGIDRVDIST